MTNLLIKQSLLITNVVLLLTVKDCLSNVSAVISSHMMSRVKGDLYTNCSCQVICNKMYVNINCLL